MSGENDNTNERHDEEQVTDRQEVFMDEPDQNAWTPTAEMSEFTTEIFRKNLLSNSTRRSILQGEPRNKNISFTPPDMDKRMWNQMSRTSREHDKDIRRLLYRVSAAVRPVDNILRFIYAAKPGEEADNGAKEAWAQLEQTTLNARALVLDSLSFGNEIRKEQALKSISPGYKKPSEHSEVFGDELPEIIQRENQTNKLFNDAAWQKRRSYQSFTPRTQATTTTNFRPPNTNYRGRGRGSNWKQKTNQGNQAHQGNSFNGGQQNRQSSF
jgi:hypothetical protein